MFDIGPIVDAILKDGGVWAAAFLLAVAAVVLLYRALRESDKARLKDAKACAAEAKEMFEARFQDGAKLVDTVRKSTELSLTTATLAESRAQAFDQFAKAQAIIAEQSRAFQTSTKEQLDRVERRQEDLQRRAERVDQAAQRLEVIEQMLRSDARSRT